MNSGTDSPGTNSARSMRISIVDGATWTVTPCWWHRSTRSSARSCGNSGSAMMTSWTFSTVQHVADLVKAARTSADRCGAACRATGSRRCRRWRGHRPPSASATAPMRLPGPDEHGPPAVADLLEQPPGELGVGLTQRAVVQQPERERPVEDPVAGEVLAVGQREDQPEQRRLEQPGGDLGEARAAGPVGVQIQPREREHGEQIGERQEVPRRRPRRVDREPVLEQRA